MELIGKAVAKTVKVEQNASPLHTRGRGSPAAGKAAPGASMSGKRAVAEWDYKKVEDNEINLVKGQYVANISSWMTTGDGAE
jgi:hypothetical protein